MSAARGSRTRPGASGVPWDAAVLTPLTLLWGKEDFLADRGVERLIALARAKEPATEVTHLDGSSYAAGSLTVVTSPSLFGEPRVVVVAAAETANDAFFTDLFDYVETPEPDVVLVVAHAGGNRGKKGIDALRAAGAQVVACQPITSPRQKADFVTSEFARVGRKADSGAVRALVDAVGNDLRELAAACAQLAADTTGPITAQAVDLYYGGRVEVTAFKVADAAVAGDFAQAVALLRHTLATGTDPVPIVAALASKLRTLVKVGAARGRQLDPVNDLGIAPWQVDRARRELANWTPEGLATAITAVATADEQVKGGGRDPVYALEKAVLAICQAAGR